MVTVHVDPEKLRNFAAELKKFSDVVGNYISVLPNEMNRLGNTWQDQEFVKFRHEFAPLIQTLKGFVDESTKIIPKLERDVTEIEAYFKIQK